MTYDWIAQRWLPVPSQFVAPDGLRYAYTDAQSRIHLVTVASGDDNVMSAAGPWGLYAFTVRGLYAGRQDPNLNGPTGLYVLTPDGSSAVQLAAAGTWPLVGNDAAWSFASTEAAPTGSNVLGNVVGSKLVRFDLATDQQEAWYLSTDGRVGMGALDRLNRPVLVNVDTGRVLLVTALNSATEVFNQGLPLTVTADAHGVWIAHPFTLAIYLSADGSPATRWGQYGYSGAIKFAGVCG